MTASGDDAAMIRELLDPVNVRKAAQTLLESFDEERFALKRGDDETRTAADAVEASASDLDDAEQAVTGWQQREIDDVEGEDESKPPIWVARDPISSLIQSVFEEFFLDRGFTRAEKGPGLGTVEHAITDLELTQEGFELLDADTRRKRFWPKFGQRDARFLTWGAVAKLATVIKSGPTRFPERDGPTIQIADDARLILVGDWGSGVPRAEKVATAMRIFVEDAVRENQQCHVIHLGDVYYCGWLREFKRRFLANEFWPVSTALKDRVGSWSLNANHEMYSGGYDYFNFLLGEERFERQQGCSYFALENKHWQIAAVDTAYTEWELHGNQVQWLSMLRKSAPKKAGLLLSHHQPFCAYSKVDPRLLAAVRPVLDEGLVRAWFFGHEHKCALYSPREGIEYPRLIGHGGVPVYAYAGNKPPNVTYEMTDVMTDAKTGWEFARFGFVVLDFKTDGTILTRYISENGTTHIEETLKKS